MRPRSEAGRACVSSPWAVLFDLDDTLTDRAASLRRFAGAFASAFADRLAPCDAAELIRRIRAADRVDGGRSTSRSGPDRHHHDVAAELVRVLPWRAVPPAAELAAYWAAQLPACSEPTDGLHDTLAWLRARGLRTGIVTNGAVARQAPKVEALGLGGLVDCVVVSEAVGVQKPDRRIFRIALGALEVVPERAWFVGDNPVNDVLGAAAAGMTAVWLRRGAGWPDAHPEPERRIDVLGDLIPLIGRALCGLDACGA